jgi:formate dehydrogenase iron-sulfur subunit
VELTRRSFISLPKSSLVSAQNESTVSRRNSSSSEEGGHGVLVDITKCTGCRACVIACKQWNHLKMSTQPDRGKDPDDPPGLNCNSFTTIRTIVSDATDEQPVYWKRQCMHCLEPACQGACIVGALRRNKKTGAVRYDRGKCIGCRYCMVACPFGIPTYEWDDWSPWIKKCTFCYNRQADNLQPACTGTCPTGALKFGNRADLLGEAWQRINDASVGTYHEHVYGEEEAGGTAWMYISPVAFEDLDFAQITDEPVPRNARKAMGTLPYYAIGVIGLMGAIYWVTKRRQKLAAGGEKKEG